MRVFSVLLAVSVILPGVAIAEQQAQSKPKGLERIAAGIFVARCIDESRENWSDEASLRHRYRSRIVGETESISGFSVFNDDTVKEFVLDSRVDVTSFGRGGEGRAIMLGGIKSTEAQQFCYFSSDGARREKIVAELENQGARVNPVSDQSAEETSYCFNRLRRGGVSHEIFIFSRQASTENDVTPRGEILIRYDVAGNSTSCL